MKFIYRYVLFVTLLVSYEGRAQIGLKLGSSPGTLSPNAILDLSGTSNRGFLLPRLALTGTANSAPLAGTVTSGMLVYNTATAGDVTPGVYYADGTRWVRVAANGTGGTIQASSTSLVSATSPAGTTGQIVYNTNAASGLPVGLVVWNGSAWVSGGGDNLGNHTATEDVKLGAFGITGIAATNDPWRIFGRGSTIDNGELVIQSGDNGNEPIVFEMNNVGTGTITERMRIGGTGVVSINNLAGTGSRMVVADATGVLSAQAIPVSSNIYTADGTLTGNRTVSLGTNKLNFVLAGTSGALTIDNGHTGRNPRFIANGNDTLEVQTSSNPYQLVLLPNGNVGLGLANPSQRLHVAGGALISSLGGTGSRMVVADAAGVLSTQAIPTSSNIYNTNGTLTASRTVSLANNNLNFDTGAGILTIARGHSQSNPRIIVGDSLEIQTGGNAYQLFLSLTSGHIGLGTNAPTQRLHVSGNALISGLSGTGSRMVVADASGVLSTQPIAVTSNIYTSDGGLAGDRIVGQGTSTLNFSGTGKLFVGNIAAGSTPHAGRLAAVTGRDSDIALTVMNDSTSSVGNTARIGFRTQGSNGGAGLTAIIGAEQTNTNLASDLTFSTYNGTTMATRMRIAANGDVGIGVDSPFGPSGNLHVRARENTPSAELNISTANEGNQAIISLTTPVFWLSNIKKTAIVAQGLNSFSRADLHFVLNSTADNGVNYTTGADTKMIIKNNGNVGIGTINPSQRLHVAGGALISSLGGTGSRMVVADASGVLSTQALPTNDNLGNHTATAGLNMGRFGINGWADATPTTGNNDDWRIYGTGALNAGALIIETGDDGNEPIIFQQRAAATTTERMRIAGNGRIGIGTSAPDLDLDIQSSFSGVNSGFGIRATAGSWDHFYLTHDGTAASFNAGGAENGLRFRVGNGGTGTYGNASQNYNTAMTIMPDGRVGINTTTPASRLEVGENATWIRLHTSTNDATFQLKPAATTNWARLTTAGSPLAIITNGVNDLSNTSPSMFITSAGNVGVGTSNPTARVHVEGGVRIVDGTQGAGKVLVSDASGNASWASPASIVAAFGVINGTSIVDLSTAGWKNFNATITLNPGRWAVTAVFQIGLNGTVGTGVDQYRHVLIKASTSATSFSTSGITVSAPFITLTSTLPEGISGAGTTFYWGQARGTTIIENTGTTPVTIHFGSDETVTKMQYRGSFGENSISALKLN